MFDSPFPATRAEALEALHEFIPQSGKYSRTRNHVIPGHGNVSQLSAAIRHRLITEWETAQAPLERYATSTVEKFTQEIYWRSYWKGWLSQRPQVWDSYEAEAEGASDEAEAIISGQGPIGLMNHFAAELRQTGYLHNHARMWFAGYWVHVAQLPWQWGARFFERELLDFDPASNTLSWRWVAGLQTPGKTYLPRRSNLEKFLDPQIFATAGTIGLELLEQPKAKLPKTVERPAIIRAELTSDPLPTSAGLWVHEEDLCIENSELADFSPQATLVTYDAARLCHIGASENRKTWLKKATLDAAKRLNADHAEFTDLLTWVKKHGLKDLVTLRPEIGPLHDRLDQLKSDLTKLGVTLHLIIRKEDALLRPLAKKGFFPFWLSLQKQLKSGEFPPSSK